MRTLTIAAVACVVALCSLGCNVVQSGHAGIEVYNNPARVYLPHHTIHVQFTQDGRLFRGGVVTVSPYPAFTNPASWDVDISRKGVAHIYLPDQCTGVTLNIAYGMYGYGPITIKNENTSVNCTDAERRN